MLRDFFGCETAGARPTNSEETSSEESNEVSGAPINLRRANEVRTESFDIGPARLLNRLRTSAAKRRNISLRFGAHAITILDTDDLLRGRSKLSETRRSEGQYEQKRNRLRFWKRAQNVFRDALVPGNTRAEPTVAAGVELPWAVKKKVDR